MGVPLSDTDSLSSADDTHFKGSLRKRTSLSVLTGNSTNNSDNITLNNSSSVNASSSLTTNENSKSYVVTRKDKLDSGEVKDLLICVVYILKNISHGIEFD